MVFLSSLKRPRFPSLPKTGDHYMIEIKEDRVAKAVDLKGVEVGMSVADLLARLRLLAKFSR